MAFFKPRNKPRGNGSNQYPGGEDPYGPSAKAIIYRSELDFISRCILDYPNIETGGELFGFWTQLGSPVVLYAVGPGPRATHNPTAFLQDPDYVDNVEVEICNRTGLQHIGQWHSHHQLGLAHPSGGDVASMQRGVGQPGFPRMLLCIGNCTRRYETTVNAFNFHENYPGQYLHAKWDIINMESPFRTEINVMFGQRLYSPQTREARHTDMHEDRSRTQAVTRNEYRQHWLTEKVENVELMKGFLKTAETIRPDSAPAAEIMDSGEPIVALYGGDFRIMLPYGFPETAPRYTAVDGRECLPTDSINEDAGETWMALFMPLDAKFHVWLQNTLPFRAPQPAAPTTPQEAPDLSTPAQQEESPQQQPQGATDDIDLNDEE